MSCALGGFVFALFLEACKANGLIETIGLRYILYVALGTIAFSLSCHPRLQSYLLIGSSAHVGATATILGIDCFTKANLKEFYIRNLGFDDLFSRKYPDEFAHNRWFLSTASIIELGVLAGLTLMAISFQSKMWSEFRASLSMMQHDDEERRLQAKAKRAAKKVFASAQRDLREWEERHGYRKTGGYVNKEEDDYKVTTNPSSDFAQNFSHDRKGSTMSLLPIKGPDSPRPILDYRPPSTQYERTLAEEIGLQEKISSTGSPKIRDSLSRDEQAAGLKQSMDALSEQQTLLEEIAMIRKSIGALQSVSPGPNRPGSSEDTPSGRFSSASMHVRSATESHSPTTPSPWLTMQRGRTRSITTYMEAGPSVVDHTLFSGPEKTQDGFYRPYTSPERRGSEDRFVETSSPRISQRDYLGDVSRPLSAMLKGNPIPEEGKSQLELERRPRYSTPTTPPSEVAREQKRRSMVLLGSDGSTLPYSNHNSSSSTSPPTQNGQRSRTILDSKAEAEARYARALNRDEAPRKNKTSLPLTPEATAVVSRPEYKRRSTTMSVGELQARHQSRLKAMQQPTNTRIEEEARLQKAKEEWNRRSQLEKRRFEEMQKVKQRKSTLPEATLESTAKRRTASTPTPQQSTTQVLETLIQMPEQSGLSRAKVWRRSLAQSEDSPEQKQMTRRSYVNPLLDFSAEEVREKTKERVQRPGAF